MILLHLGVFLLYSIAVSFAAFFLPPVYGVAAALLVLWLVLRFYLVRPGSPDEAERETMLRLRPLRGPVLRWTLAAAPVMLLLSWSLGELYISVVPVPPRILNPFGDLVLDPGSRLVLAVLAIAAAPVVEEMFFRGLIQHPLERRIGAAAGIGVAALLFALVHIDTLPWVIPLHFVLGAIFGLAVYITRSIWSGVILHAVNNVAAFVGLDAQERGAAATVWERGIDSEVGIALGVLAASIAAGTWIVRGMHRAAARELERLAPRQQTSHSSRALHPPPPDRL